MGLYFTETTSEGKHSEMDKGPMLPDIILGFQTGASYDIASLRIHHHFFDDHLCSHRFEIRITILGIFFGIGLVQYYQ